MIIDLVESMSPMLEDAEHSGMTSGFGVPRRKSIKAGDAKGVAEGTANDDEENEFDLLSLEGIEIKKHAVLSRKMKFKSIDAFEAWLVNELAERIAVAKNRVIRNRLDGVAPDGGSAIAARHCHRQHSDRTEVHRRGYSRNVCTAERQGRTRYLRE